MGEVRDILTDRVVNWLGRVQCKLGTHQWIDHPAITASKYPAHNVAGDVVGSWIPTEGIVTRTATAFRLDDPERPVDPPQAFPSYFQATREERPAFTSCGRCGRRA